MVLMTKDRSRVFCRAFLTNTISDHAQKSIVIFNKLI